MELFNMPPLLALRDFIPLGIASLWPLTILFIVWCFRKEIKELINHVTEANIFNLCQLGSSELELTLLKGY